VIKKKGLMEKFARDGVLASPHGLAPGGFEKGNLVRRVKPLVKHTVVKDYRIKLSKCGFKPNQIIIADGLIRALRKGSFKTQRELKKAVEIEVDILAKKLERKPVVSASALSRISVALKRHGVIV
jgi:hypothetical protein